MAKFSSLGITSFKAGLLVNNAHKAFHALLSTCLGHHGLTVPLWSVLGSLYHQPDRRPIEISQDIGVTAPYTTILLTELEAKKLVKSTKQVDDERSKQVRLTAAGHRLVETVEMKLNVCLNDQFKDLSAEDLRTYFELSNYIASNVTHHPDL